MLNAFGLLAVTLTLVFYALEDRSPAFDLFFIGQACELVHEHQGVLRRDLEFLAARLARDLIVQAEQIVAELRELFPIGFVGARRQPVLLRAAHPPDAVLGGASAPWT